MKSVIFNIYDNNSVSTKRFLLVADHLINQNIKCYFLDFTNELYEVIEDHARMLGVNNLPIYIAYDDFFPEQESEIISLSSAQQKKQCIPNNQADQKSCPTDNKLGNILTSLNFDNSALIGSRIEGFLNSFIKDISAAQNILEIVKPSCTISDIQMPQRNRALLYAAKQKNIKTLSMEHGEGNAEQYDKLPIMYDYYIAYSPYNHNKLMEMGVKEEQIFLTGFPETDLIYNYNIEEIKKELSGQYGINFNKKIILVALKPNCGSCYINFNKQLLDKCAAGFNNSNDFQIVVKQHPIDLIMSLAEKDFYELFSSEYNNMKIVKGDFIISKLFAVSDFFLTLQSSAIVEALLQKTPTIVIDEEDNGRWPNWNRFDSYDSIKFDDLEKYLTHIKNGIYQSKIIQSENNWGKFVSYFRYKFDEGSTIRITKAIKEIIGMDIKKINTFNHPNLQDEQPFNTKIPLPSHYSLSPNNSMLKDGSGGITWEQVRQMPVIRFYAGDIPERKGYDGMIGLSLKRNDQNHLLHDITQLFPLEDNSVDSFQAEDVFEHIPYEKLVPIADEIYRVLKPDGFFRLSVPDYGCDVLQNRSTKDEKGQIVYDSGGGGTLGNPGHVWFPRIDTVMQLLTKTKFHGSGKIELLHYYNKDGTFITKPIDYSKGHIMRTPDFDQRVNNPYRPMSLVTDLTKSGETLRQTRNESRHPEGLINMQEQSVIKTEPVEPVEKCRQAHILMKQGHVLKALDQFDKILAFSLDILDARLGRITCLARLGRLLEAEVEAGTLRSQDQHNQQFQQLYEHIRHLKQTLVGERDIEWDFVRRQLVEMAKAKGQGAKVLDFGCGHTAQMTLFAAKLGYQVTAVDMVSLTVSIENFPNVRFVQADFLKHEWSKQSFDLIINCSSVEHAGLAGRYGVVESGPDDDLKIMAQMTRLLKPDGRMLLTIPVGQDTVVGSLHRVYGQKRLSGLLKGWEVESSCFWMKDENDKHRPTDEESALQREPMLAYGLGCFVLQPVSITDELCETKDTPELAGGKTIHEPPASRLQNLKNIEKSDKCLKMQVIGTEYGGWAVDLDLIPFGSTVISAGVGEDISFDLGLINLKSCGVIGIDPTEKARKYIENNKNEHFCFLQKALYSDSNKKIRIYKNTNPNYVSESITSSHKSVSGADFYEAETISIHDLLKNYKNVSVLKIDIEGAEYEVLNSICKLDIPQICVEFHHFCTDFTINDTEKCIKHLQRMGYILAHCTNERGAVKEATFVHQKYISKKPADMNIGEHGTYFTKDIPVILVCFNRPKHTIEVLNALREHNVQNLYVFSDAPKSHEDAEAVSLTRRLIHNIDWTKPKIIEHTENLGLAQNIVSAVDYIFERYDRLILLEDDCVPQRYFFDFMHTCLQKYENNPKVFGISGYTVKIPDEVLESHPHDLYFCPRIGSWGWATWKGAWQHRAKDLLELINTAVKNGIDLDQGGTDIPVALNNILKGNVKDVWTLHWVLSVYLNNGVYVYPTRSHILNVGMDGTGIHCKTTNKYNSPSCDKRPVNYPDEVFLDKDMMANFRSYYDVGPARKTRDSLVTKSRAGKAAMKICYINAGDMKGGAHRVGWMLKQGLEQRGFQTAMFVKNKMSNNPDVSIITDAIADSNTSYKDKGFLYYDINSTFTLPAKEGFITSDIIHYHNLHGDYFNPFALPDLTESKPSIWTLHDMQSMTGHCAYAFDCEKWQAGCGNCPHPEAYPPITKDRTAEMWHDKKLIYKESDFELIVPSQWLKNIVEKSILKDKRIHLIYNGIDKRIYRPLDKNAIRKMFKIPPNAVVISFVAHGGLIDKRKGGDFILEAYKYFTAKYPNVFFICVGGISNKAPTERFLQVPFVLDEEKLVQLYCAADIFLFPTLADNCPLVVLEVMGCGVPIVSFNIGGVPELIEHGKTGLIAEFKNSEEFIKMTEYLVTDRKRREEFGAAGRERLLKMFTLEQMIDKHIALYERLAEEDRKKSYVPPKNKVALPEASSDKQYKYLVSAIVSTYNSEKHIRECLQDLENQTIADRLEIIVVNSGSQQNEEAIVRDFQSRYDNIKYIKTKERETIYKAWNRSIKAASGKYITNANTDDRHRKDALEIMAKTLDENPNKILVYANQLEVNEVNRRRVTVGEMINSEFSRARLFAGQCPPGSQPMWRKDVHEIFGYFDEIFTIAGDYEFWFRLTQKYDFIYLNEILGERYIAPEVVSLCNTGQTINFENMVIQKSYAYALQEEITIGAEGISEHPVFSNWPEVNIWKQNTKARLEDRQTSLRDNIKTKWDFRTNPSPKITIVVVTYKRHESLLENLYALNEQNEKDFEVIVMDNGGDLSWLKQHKDEFNFGLCEIELNLNFGPSPARNIGTDFAKAEYIAFLDDDAVADKDLVRNIIKHFKNYNISGLRGKVLPKNQTNPENIPVNYDLGDQVITTACEVSCLSAFRKDVFVKMGGFDELLFGSEGMDLSYRICKAQEEKTKSILYFADIVVYHNPRSKSSAQTEKMLRQDRMELLAHQKDNEITGYKELVHSLYPGNKAILKENCKNYEWVINVAIYLQQNFPEEAVEWAKKAVALDPDRSKGCYILGSLYTGFGRYDEALPLLERIFEPLRSLLMSSGSEFISSEFKEQVDISECYIKTCTQLAQCYIQNKQYEKVKQIYTELLNNRNLTLAKEQKADVLNVLRSLDKISSMPAITKNEAIVSTKLEENYLVSAIISTYNSEKFLSGCLEDLEQQTIADKLEIIVVNSGSQENEEAIVHEYQQKYANIVYIKTEQREGIYAAWNRAVKVARGTFLTNANTDDRHRDDALEIMAKMLLANPDIALVYGDQICTDTPNCTFANHHAIEMAKRPEYSHERLLFGCCVGSQPMWRKSLHTKFGYFDESLICAGDWDFWLRVSISSKCKFKHMPEFLGLYYYNENGIEHGKKIHSLYERYIVGKRYGNPYISVIPLYTSKDNPLVSVIMPAYNAAEHIAEAIESVLIQNYRNFELIVIDDGSTDNTRNIVTNFKNNKIKYFYKDNGGPSDARNLALSKTMGQYIIPLDADDMMTPDFIAKHLQEFEKHPEADLVYCDDYLIDEKSKPIRVIKRPEYINTRLLIRDLFHNGFPIVPFRTCFRRSVLDKIGLFDEELLVGEDYDMIRRFVRHGLKMHHLQSALYLRRMTSDSLSRNFSAQKAKCHFEVIRRFTDTFTYDELFPDVAWDQIAPGMRQLHAKCLTAGNYLALGQEYIKSNALEYSRTAFDRACSELNDCIKLDPKNQGLQQLLQKSKRIRARYTKAAQQAVTI